MAQKIIFSAFEPGFQGTVKSTPGGTGRRPLAFRNSTSIQSLVRI